jgi:nitrite reductase/ring-hydroxylating ferredoxin subunit
VILDTGILSSDLRDKSFKKITLQNNEEIVIGKMDNKLFAFNNICPHRGASLTKGTLHGNNIVCYMHGYEYNVFTGKLENMKSWKKDDRWMEQTLAWRHSGDLKTYNIYEKNGKILIEIN